jgi:hypothetical protein
MATVAKGYDLEYAWRAVGEAYRGAGYYLAAAEAGEPPGTWSGLGAERLGFRSSSEGGTGALRPAVRATEGSGRAEAGPGSCEGGEGRRHI